MNSPAPSHQLADPERQARDPRRVELLRSLRDDGPAGSINEAAARVGVPRHNVSHQVVSVLEMLGLVRAFVPHNGKSKTVAITPAGLAKLAEIEAEATTNPEGIEPCPTTTPSS